MMMQRLLRIALGCWVRALAFVGALLLGDLASADEQSRVALVIGNGAYEFAPKLDNPVVDAKAVAAALRRLGFDVREGYDLTSAQMRSTVKDFADALSNSQAALIYYAGHGVSVDEENYLLPVDIRLTNPSGLDLDAISVTVLLRQMHREERVNIVILDACRDNPFAADLARSKTRAVIGERGLSRVDGELARGALIAFASDPKSEALDGAPGDHSPFTKALLDHVEDSGVSIDTVMSRVRSQVWATTKNRQLPWVNTSLIGEFELNPGTAKSKEAPPATPAVASLDPRGEEYLVWDSAERSNLPGDYQVYLDRFPNGVFAAMARNRIAALGSKPAAPDKLPPSPAVSPEPDGAEIERRLNLDLAARKQVQQRLAALGLDSGVDDGDFGDRTRGTIREWQRRHKLEATGWLGPQDYPLLISESEVPYRRRLSELAAPVRPEPARPVAPAPKLRQARVVAAASKPQPAAAATSAAPPPEDLVGAPAQMLPALRLLGKHLGNLAGAGTGN